MRTFRLLLAILLCSTVTLACTHAARPKGAPSSRPTASRPAQPPPPRPLPVAWRSTGFAPVSGVQIVGNRALVYGSAGGRMYLYGLDTTTGRVAWRQAASTSSVTHGIPVSVEVIDGRVVYFRPASAPMQAFALLVLADPRTGRDVAVTRDYERWLTTPAACADGTSNLCAAVYLGDINAFVQVDPRTGAVTFVQADAKAFRWLGAGGIADLSGDGVDRIGRLVGPKEVWQHTVAEMFGRGYSPDNGWDFERYQQQTVTIGTLYRRPSPPAVDLQLFASTAAVRLSDGKILWRRAGASLGCFGQLDLWAMADIAAVRCQYRGTVRDGPVQKDGSRTPVFTGLDVIIEGFDPVTGASLWQRDLGAAPQLTWYSAQQPKVVDDDSISVNGLTIDLRTGLAHPTGAAQSMWCQDDHDFAQSPDPDPDTPGPSIRYSSQLVRACNAVSGQSVAPTAVPDWVSAQVTALRLVSTRAAVIAYRVP